MVPPPLRPGPFTSPENLTSPRVSGSLLRSQRVWGSTGPVPSLLAWTSRVSAQNSASSLMVNSMPVWSAGPQRWLQGLGAFYWLQMPCPRGAMGTGLGPWECGAPKKPRGSSQTHQGHVNIAPVPGAPVGEGLQVKDLCDCSEAGGQQGGSTGCRVRGGWGAARAGPGLPEGPPPREQPPEDALSSQTRRGQFRCHPWGRAQE